MRTLKTRPILTRKPSDRYIADAIAILGKYGGSLWVPDPRYSRVSSDGSGPQTDTGSDVGYVRDLCASYGSELVSNGDFSQGTTGWTVFQPTAGAVTFDGTKATVNSTDGSIAGLLKTSLLVVGKVYELSFDVVVRSGQCIVGDNNTVTYALANTTGKFKAVFTATSTALQIKRGAGGLPNDFDIDNISVREIVGRPLFQATTGFKPKLKRVPKKLGPELIVDNSFGGTSGWVLGSGFSIAGGQLTANAVAMNQSAYRQVSDSTLQAGKSYQFEIVCSSYTSGTYALLATGGANPIGDKASAGTFTGVLNNATAGAVYIWSKQTLTAVFDSISVREVLEWGWAWVFDGVDDGLATVAQPTTSSETIIAISQRGPSRATESKYVAGRVSSADISTGSAIYQGASNMQPYGLCVGNIYGPYSDQSVHVISAVAAQTGFKVRQSGVQVGTGSLGAYTSNSNPISIGKAVNTARYFNAGVFAAAYAPVAIPDAELLIVERAMAQLAGVTI